MVRSLSRLLSLELCEADDAFITDLLSSRSRWLHLLSKYSLHITYPLPFYVWLVSFGAFASKNLSTGSGLKGHPQYDLLLPLAGVV